MIYIVGSKINLNVYFYHYLNNVTYDKSLFY